MNKISTSRKTLIALALPLLLETVLKNLMGTVNVFMLSSYSDTASAAVGVANQIINVAIITFNAIGTGSIIIINQQLGAGRDREAAKVSMNALSMALVLGGAASLLLIIFAKQFLIAMGLDETLLAPAMTYLRGVGALAIVIAATTEMSALFRSHKNTRTPMIVVVITNILNALGAWIVVFRPFETPLEGVMGIVIVRIISECVGLIVITAALFRAGYGFKIRDILRPEFSLVKKTAKLAGMVSMEGLSYSLGQVFTTSFITSFGTAALSAKVYVQTVSIYTYMCGQCVGQAAQIISGHLIGAGERDEAYHFVWKCWRIVLAFNLMFSGALFLLHKPIIGLFSRDPEILKIAGTLLLIDIGTNIVRSFNHSVKLGLTGSGYTFVPMLIAVGSIWTLNVGGGWFFSTVCSLGIAGLWFGQFADEAFRGITQAFLWKSRVWEKSIIVKN